MVEPGHHGDGPDDLAADTGRPRPLPFTSPTTCATTSKPADRHRLLRRGVQVDDDHVRHPPSGGSRPSRYDTCPRLAAVGEPAGVLAGTRPDRPAEQIPVEAGDRPAVVGRQVEPHEWRTHA